MRFYLPFQFFIHFILSFLKTISLWNSWSYKVVPILWKWNFMTSSIFIAKISWMATPRNTMPSTTYVQADPNTFCELVQRLTGSFDSSKTGTEKPPAGAPPQPASSKQQPAKLYERRQYTGANLEIAKPAVQFKQSERVYLPSPLGWFTPKSVVPSPMPSSTPRFGASPLGTPSAKFSNLSIFDNEKVEQSREERAIRENGFYLFPSPVSKPEGSRPVLLDLFPQTPTKRNHSWGDCRSASGLHPCHRYVP